MPAYLGYEAEQHGKARRRVLSLDVYPDLVEKAAALAVWDEYALGQDGGASDANTTLAAIPPEIRAIGEKRVLGIKLTPTERKQLQRFRQGTYTGRRGRPKMSHKRTRL